MQLDFQAEESLTFFTWKWGLPCVGEYSEAGEIWVLAPLGYTPHLSMAALYFWPCLDSFEEHLC